MIGEAAGHPTNSKLETRNSKPNRRLRPRAFGQGENQTVARSGPLHAHSPAVARLARYVGAMLGNTDSINVMEKVGLAHDYDDVYDEWPGEDKRCVWYSLKLK